MVASAGTSAKRPPSCRAARTSPTRRPPSRCTPTDRPSGLGLGTDPDPRSGRSAPAFRRRGGAWRRMIHVGAHLLGPVAGHAAADGEDAQTLAFSDPLREVLQVEEGVEAQGLPPGLAPQPVVDGEVEAQLRVREGGHVDGHLAPVGAAQHGPVAAQLFETPAQGAADGGARQHLARLVQRPQRVLEQALHVVQVLLQLDGVVDPVVALAEELLVAHLRAVLEMEQARPLAEAVGHERAGADDRLHPAAIDHLADHQALLGDGHRARDGQHAEALGVAHHGLEHVGGLAQAPPSEGGAAHGAHQRVDSVRRLQVQGGEGLQAVFVAATVGVGGAGLLAQARFSWSGARGRSRRRRGWAGSSWAPGTRRRWGARRPPRGRPARPGPGPPGSRPGPPRSPRLRARARAAPGPPAPCRPDRRRRRAPPPPRGRARRRGRRGPGWDRPREPAPAAARGCTEPARPRPGAPGLRTARPCAAGRGPPARWSGAWRRRGPSAGAGPGLRRPRG